MNLLEETNMWDRANGRFGIEIEMEGRGFVEEPLYWIAIPDNSLRDGIEYVLRLPLDLEEVGVSISTLVKALAREKAKPVFTFRTSVHVHLNVQDMSYDELLNLVYTYAILENVLLMKCGDSRIANRFCLRIQDAEYLVSVLEDMFTSTAGRFMRDLPRNQVRYSALNLEALTKFGSLEFRSMEGTLDENRITEWCSMLGAMQEFARKFKNPFEVFEFYQKNTGVKFYEAVFGELGGTYNPDMVSKEVVNNFCMTISLPFAYKRVKLDAPKIVPPKAPRREERFKIDPQVDPVRIRPLDEVLRGMRANEAIMDDLV